MAEEPVWWLKRFANLTKHYGWSCQRACRSFNFKKPHFSLREVFRFPPPPPPHHHPNLPHYLLFVRIILGRSSDSCWDLADASQTADEGRLTQSSWHLRLCSVATSHLAAGRCRCCPLNALVSVDGRDDEERLKTKNRSGTTRRCVHHRQAPKWIEFIKSEDKQTSFKNIASHEWYVDNSIAY